MSVPEVENHVSRGAPVARPSSRRFNWDWLGVAPFFLFATFFLILPSISIFIRSFEAVGGGFTFDNIIALFTERDIINAYKTSLGISLITALAGGIFGFLLAYAVILGGLPVVTSVPGNIQGWLQILLECR